MEAAEGASERPGFKRPRKPEDDTIAYFRGLEVPLRSEDDLEARAALVENLFEEISLREASLATHRKCSVLIEAALRLASPRCVVEVAERMLPYCGFLASDRYGSHVLQTTVGLLLGCARAGGQAEEEDDAEDEGGAAKDGAAADGAPKGSISQRAAAVGVKLFEVLVRSGFWDVVYEQSGAHVLRTLLSSLLGHDEEAGRRVAAKTKPTSAQAGDEADADAAGADSDREEDAAGKAAVRAAEVAAKRRGSAGKGMRKRQGGGGSAEEHAAAAAATAAVEVAKSDPEAAVAIQGSGQVLGVPPEWSAAAAEWAGLLAASGSDAMDAASALAACGFITHALDRWRAASRLVRTSVNRAARAAAKRDNHGGEPEGTAEAREWAVGVDRATDAVCLTLLGWPVPPELTGEDYAADEAAWLGWLSAGPDATVAERLATDRVTSRAAEAALRNCSRRSLSLGVCRRLLLPSGVARELDAKDGASAPAPSGKGVLSAGLFVKLATHHMGNFVAQAALAAVCGASAGDAMSAQEAGAGMAPSRPVLADEAASLIDVLTPALGTVLVSRLDGVVWRVAQAAASLGSLPTGQRLQEGVVAALVGSVPATGGPRLLPPAARLAVWLMDADGWRTGGAGANDGSSREDGAASSHGPRSRSRGGRKGGAPSRGTPVSAAGIKVVSVCAACFRPPVQRPLVESLASVPADMLVSIARSPWGSRHLLEPLLSLTGPKMGWVSVRLGRTLRSKWADLAQDRMSAWVVSRAFEAGDSHMKERIAAALIPAERALQGTPFGRKIATAVKLDHFQSHRASWRQAVQQASKRESTIRALVDEVDKAAEKAVQAVSRPAKPAAASAAEPARAAPAQAAAASAADSDSDDAESADSDSDSDSDDSDSDSDAAEEENEAGEQQQQIPAAAAAQAPGPATNAASEQASRDSSDSDDSDESDEDDDDDVPVQRGESAASRAGRVVATLDAAQADPFATLLRGATIGQRAAEAESSSESEDDSDDEDHAGGRAMKRPREAEDEDGQAEDKEEEDKPAAASRAGRRRAGEAIRLALSTQAGVGAPSATEPAQPAAAAAAPGAMAFLFGGEGKVPPKALPQRREPKAKRPRVDEQRGSQRGKHGGGKASDAPPGKGKRAQARLAKAAAIAASQPEKKKHRGKRGGKRRTKSGADSATGAAAASDAGTE
ncbi:hypothetical protein FNF29_02125 [Cafeteria roenbergensis]|uniref:PUM-HD domain-containing protein n=1 Tax=Cafeteria roenbergensis TaxID=33653 RepID=A0A5A8CT81_CAFRO|nr:hypothetical protein FNF29_02125 [Cafeteria roenbergensis]|eukprot:KAA0154981.1 hypothetical protein FNF29_02125 [Cafeteria roenbergensis]